MTSSTRRDLPAFNPRVRRLREFARANRRLGETCPVARVASLRQSPILTARPNLSPRFAIIAIAFAPVFDVRLDPAPSPRRVPARPGASRRPHGLVPLVNDRAVLARARAGDRPRARATPRRRAPSAARRGGTRRIRVTGSETTTRRPLASSCLARLAPRRARAIDEYIARPFPARATRARRRGRARVDIFARMSRARHAVPTHRATRLSARATARFRARARAIDVKTKDAPCVGLALEASRRELSGTRRDAIPRARDCATRGAPKIFCARRAAFSGFV